MSRPIIPTGCLLSEVDGSGRRREYGDVSGRLVESSMTKGCCCPVWYYSLGLTNEYVMGWVWRYLRDGFGRLRLRKTVGWSNSHEYIFVFWLEFCRVSFVAESGSSTILLNRYASSMNRSPEVERVSYGHDGYGRTSRVLMIQVIIEYVRDENGRLCVKSDDGQWVRYGHGRFDDVMG